MGYPRSLRGTDIPLEARIFSVADAYDAMVSPRPYRQTLTHEEAVREIICHAGSQFDPQVVAVFARWAVQVSDESTREMVEEEVQRLPAGLPRLDRARWAVQVSNGSTRDMVEEELQRLPAGLLQLDRARWG